MPEEIKHKTHHIWCNFFMRKIEDCPQCPRLWREYPYDENSSDGSSLHEKHFPDVIKRT